MNRGNGMNEWIKSSFCSGGDCVEVGQAPHGAVTVRDTKDRARELVFSNEEWDAFIAGAKNGEFDRPQTRPQSLVSVQTHPDLPVTAEDRSTATAAGGNRQPVDVGGAALRHIEIKSDGGKAAVVLNGLDISRSLTGATFELRAGQLPVVQLDALMVTADIEGDGVITVGDDVSALLVELGWTPPAGEVA